MGAILTVARASVMPDERERAIELYREAFAEGPLSEIAEAITLWESTTHPGDYLLLSRYANEEDAERGQEAASQTEAFAQIIQLADTPPDIRRYRIAGEKGSNEAEVDLGACLSILVRQSDPGLGWDLDAELARVLDEIALLEGHLGSIHGRSATVHEEVMSIALWKDEASFRASIPEHNLFVVTAYRRVG